jgi:hypothetical protein
MNVTTINNNITKAQANVRYPEGQVIYKTDAKGFYNYGTGMQSNSNIDASHAINELLDSQSYMECERFALAVTYKNALDKLGSGVFCSRVSSVRIRRTAPFNQVPQKLQPILQSIRLLNESELKVGDWVFLSNSPQYRDLCLAEYGRVRESSGEHLIVSGTNPTLYRGHVDVVEDGLTLDQWKHELHDAIPNNHLVNVNEIGLARDENGLIIARRIKD